MSAQHTVKGNRGKAALEAQTLTSEALKLLSGVGLRKTTARSRVMARLMSAQAPLSVQDLQPTLTDLHLDPVTIYRILHVLVEHGLVRQVDLGDRTYRFEHIGTAPLHAHFVCRRCGQAWCLDEKIRNLGKLELEKQLGKGFVIESQQLLYQGWCAACTKKARGRSDAESQKS